DVEKELQRLENLDIIEQVVGPTPWVSPIVVVPKKTGEIRLCVDMREANKAVQREKHPMPTVDELITDLNSATAFSTLDLASASEIFQNEIANLLVGLPGCKNISDYIIVYGRDDTEHDENLRDVLTRLQENNAKLFNLALFSCKRVNTPGPSVSTK
ncbi:Hypothetical predicted protein, partial [Paramuricea clavata]